MCMCLYNQISNEIYDFSFQLNQVQMTFVISKIQLVQLYYYRHHEPSSSIGLCMTMNVSLYPAITVLYTRSIINHNTHIIFMSLRMVLVGTDMFNIFSDVSPDGWMSGTWAVRGES